MGNTNHKKNGRKTVNIPSPSLNTLKNNIENEQNILQSTQDDSKDENLNRGINPKLNIEIKKNYSQSYNDWEVIDENFLENINEIYLNKNDASNNSKKSKKNNNKSKNNQSNLVKKSNTVADISKHLKIETDESIFIKLFGKINIFDSLLIIMNNISFIDKFFENQEIKDLNKVLNESNQTYLSNIVFLINQYLWDSNEKAQYIEENKLFEKYKTFIGTEFKDKNKYYLFNIENLGEILVYILNKINIELTNEFINLKKENDNNNDSNEKVNILDNFIGKCSVVYQCQNCKLEQDLDRPFYYLVFDYKKIIKDLEIEKKESQINGNNDNITNQMYMMGMNINNNGVNLNQQMNGMNISNSCLNINPIQMNGMNINNSCININPMQMKGMNINNSCINLNPMQMNGMNINNSFINLNQMPMNGMNFNQNYMNSNQMQMNGMDINNNCINLNQMQMNGMNINNNCMNLNQMQMNGMNINNNFMNLNQMQMNGINYSNNSLKNLQINNNYCNNNNINNNNKINIKFNLNDYFQKAIPKWSEISEANNCIQCNCNEINVVQNEGTKIINLSNILVIELSNIEIKTFILPDQLNLSKYINRFPKENNGLYNLVSVLCKFNYNDKFICYCFNYKNGGWFSYSDGEINKEEKLDINAMPILAIYQSNNTINNYNKIKRDDFENKIKVLINFTSGNKISSYLDKNKTIKSLKEDIILGYNLKEVKLINVNNPHYKDSQKISDLNLNNEGILNFTAYIQYE